MTSSEISALAERILGKKPTWGVMRDALSGQFCTRSCEIAFERNVSFSLQALADLEVALGSQGLVSEVNYQHGDDGSLSIWVYGIRVPVEEHSDK